MSKTVGSSQIEQARSQIFRPRISREAYETAVEQSAKSLKLYGRLLTREEWINQAISEKAEREMQSELQKVAKLPASS
jgi:hypothetical protein